MIYSGLHLLLEEEGGMTRYQITLNSNLFELINKKSII